MVRGARHLPLRRLTSRRLAPNADTRYGVGGSPPAVFLLALALACALAIASCTCNPAISDTDAGYDAGCTDCGTGQCVNLTRDPDNCGTCTYHCTADQLCRGGNCLDRCGDGGVRCGILCVDVDNNRDHCGECFASCPNSSRSCVMGTCQLVCAAGQLTCSATCVDPLTDPGHCGACNAACPAGLRCAAGRCAAPACTRALTALDLGAAPSAVLAADLDGDGTSDIAVTDADGGFVHVFRVKGNDLVPGAPIKVGRSPRALAAGDIDGDGTLDLVTANFSSNSISVVSNSDAGFLPAREFPAGSQLIGVALGDLNRDSKLDAVASNFPSSATVLLNEGDGGFRVSTTFSVPGIRSSAGIADFDRDGGMDLAFACDGVVAIYVAVDDGGFVPGPVNANSSGQSLLVADFDSRNGPDLAVTQHFGLGTLQVNLNDGAGNLSATIIRSVLSPESVSAADLNKDGKLDLVVGGSQEYVATYLGAGDGTFAAAPQSFAGTFPYATALADLNHDGIVDLISAMPAAGVLAISFGEGDGTFGGPVHSGPNAGLDPIVVDFDKDGHVDLLMRVSGDTITLMKNDGAAHLAPLTLPGIRGAYRFTLLELDGDGAIDVAIGDYAQGALRVFRNTRDGGFSLVGAEMLQAADMVTADINGDGRDDVVFAETGGAVGALLNAGDGGFSRGPAIYAPGPYYAQELASGDLNADGRADVAVVFTGTIDQGVLVLMNGASGFLAPQVIASCPASRVLAVGDVAGDGLPDIVFSCTERGVRVVASTSNGFLPASAPWSVRHTPASIAIGDVTRDGLKDLVTTGYESPGVVSVLVGGGDGGFSALRLYGSSNWTSAVAIGDFDGDGKDDLAVTSTLGAADVFVNTCQ